MWSLAHPSLFLQSSASLLLSSSFVLSGHPLAWSRGSSAFLSKALTCTEVHRSATNTWLWMECGQYWWGWLCVSHRLAGWLSESYLLKLWSVTVVSNVKMISIVRGEKLKLLVRWAGMLTQSAVVLFSLIFRPLTQYIHHRQTLKGVTDLPF